ncbi:MAG: MFS transporter [Alphaproteobacteria bacterium]|nr:MFS transporter [Alphaproteobacteria bacterium]
MKKSKKLIFTAMIGNALEYYDFTLYGFFAAYLSSFYFPAEDPLTSKIASFGAFAAGFLMRPIGALIFGHLGDRYGRKTALLISIFLMTLPTLTIGFLPTYATIGFWAPLIIVLCRLMQGICTAGEYTGAIVLIAEFNERYRPGFACSLLPASSLIGAVVGTGLGAVSLIDTMPAWAWRIPFIMGFVFGLLGLYLRTQLEESPAFTNLAKHHKISDSPIFDVLKYQKRNFLCSMGVGAAALAPFYVISVYINSLALQVGLSPAQSMLLNVAALLMWMMFIPIIGYFSDRIGLGKVMSWGSFLLMFVSVPVFLFVNYNVTLEKILLAQVIFSFCGAFYVAPFGAFLATKVFPTSHRYSGMALGVSCGEALFGGTSPLIAAGLVALTGASFAPGFYLMFCGLIGWAAVNFYKPLSSSKSYERRTPVIPFTNKAA